MRSSRTFIIIFFVTYLVYSCNKSYLNKEALGLVDENVLANAKGVEGLLIGAYSLLDGISYNKASAMNNDSWGSACSNWIYGSICGSEAYKGSYGYNDQYEISDLEIFDPLATNSMLAAKWRALYDGIQRANDVLRIMQKATDITPENRVRIAAEARFLRAHYHFEAKKIWNKIPYIDETITYENNNYHVSNEGKTWPDIENDLLYAMHNLNETSYLGAVGRANKYTAMALLAKSFMFQQKFVEAKPLLDTIIGSNKYALVDNYADNFNPAGQNNKESIFIAQMSVNDESDGFNGNYGDVLNFPGNFLLGMEPGGCCGFFRPSQYLVNHFKTDTTGLPDLDHFNDNDVKNDEGIPSDSSFVPDKGMFDPRLDWTVGRRGIPYLDWGLHPGSDWTDPQNYAGPYSPKKNTYYKSQETIFTDANFWGGLTDQATANRVNLIRYADVLLWAAEVEVEIGGSLDKAQEYVNLVRNRMADHHEYWVHKYLDNNNPQNGFYTDEAHLAANYVIRPYGPGDFTTKGKDFALKAIRFERMLELGMEGHRFFDLVRWGIAETEITGYFKTEKLKRTYLNDASFSKHNEYYPIPQIQIDLSVGPDGVAKMTQNPGYH